MEDKDMDETKKDSIIDLVWKIIDTVCKVITLIALLSR